MNLSSRDDVGMARITSCCSISSHFTRSNQEIDPTVESMAKELVDEINELPIKERQHLIGEVFGDRNAMNDNNNKLEEDNEFVDKNLNLLEEELNKLSGSSSYNSVAYDLAMSMNSHYVQNRDLRLMFLRADRFNAQKASIRLITHFKHKLELFGQEKLVKRINYDDLSPDDQASLCSGAHQNLGVRDIHGRTVIFCMRELEPRRESWEHSTRAWWYLCMADLEDVSFQMKGAISIQIGTTPSHAISRILRRNKILLEAIPVKVLAVHVCLLGKKPSSLARNVISGLGKYLRLRVSFHLEETYLGLLYAIQSIGIDPKTIPIEYNGKALIDRFLEVVEKHKLLERQRSQNKGIQLQMTTTTTATTITPTNTTTNTTTESTSKDDCSTRYHHHHHHHRQSSSHDDDIIKIRSNNIGGIKPTNKDVLLGKGMLPRSHSGNSILDKMIEMRVGTYKMATSQFDKTCVAMGTMKSVQSIGGRFLRRDYDSGEWHVVDDTVAREAVCGRFRTKARKTS